MALKITSGSWLAASDENRAQRDSLRRAFFSQTGINPAKSLREVNLPPATRMPRIMVLISAAGTNRIGDAELDRITACAQEALLSVGLGIPALPTHSETASHGIAALTPEILQRFFVTDHQSAFDRSLF